MAGSSAMVIPRRKNDAPDKPKKAKQGALSVRQVLHLLHRLAILGAATWYFVVFMGSTLSTIDLLRDKEFPSILGGNQQQSLLGTYVGTTTIRQSPLVLLALQGDTTPRNGTLYLEATGPSQSVCSGVSPVMRVIYDDAFLRSLFDAIVRDTAYNLTDIGRNTELIMPVVDCLSTQILYQYTQMGKFNFLVRPKQDPDNVAIITVQLTNQEYLIAEQSERGPAAIATLVYVNDLQATTVEHHFIVSIGYPQREFNFRVCTFLGVNAGKWSLRVIPDENRGDIPKTVTSAFRTGFYKKSVSEQFNINSQINVLAHTPIEAIRDWVQIYKFVLHDSWGWVHGIQVFIGLDLLLSHAVLLIVAARNLQAGKLWVGDAFVSISSKSFLRAVAIIVSMYLDGFWSLYEFCVRDAYIVLGASLTNYPNIVYAAMLGIYLSVCGGIGVVFRERIDPLVAVFSFLLGYEYRAKFLRAFPTIVGPILGFAFATISGGSVPPEPGQELISPMGLLTPFELHVAPAMVVRILSPILYSLVLVGAYVVYCKIYRFFYPDRIRVVRNTTGTGTSGGEEMSLVQKRVLTLFEIATGAELESKFGLMSSYENYLFIKGMKFASADGIYSNGFVIANGKYVMQTGDYWSIVFITVLRWQFTRVYVYEIAGSTVQQTAKLVYPSTFTLADLTNLNISVLS
ncbi:hypothetical protein PybrP1_007890 [[Pythium] brassicae (nom. inval.)]|nr:hypothetical protein PybrP1_007890 [[Pythium] brassicae (nom. inval.)]